jgi:acetylornithine deacetylase/succinyl-diaminopimelate desuccinylase-like protein
MSALASLLSSSDQYWEADVLPVLSEYIRIPCLSPEFDIAWKDNGHVDRAAQLLCDWARSRPIGGLSVDLVELPGLTPVIIAEVASSRGAADTSPPTLLYGHLDKQPPLGAWRDGLGAFEPVREGDRFFGRGAADDGYSLFAALGAIELCQHSGIGHGRCIIIIEASEESGSPHLGAYLGGLGDRLGPAGPGLVVCLDSGATTYDRLWSTTSLRGLVAATLTVSVLTEGIHSGSGGGVVPDSFRLVRHLLDRIEDPTTGEVLLGSCRAAIPTTRQHEAKALADELGESAMDAFPVISDTATVKSHPSSSELTERLLARTWHASIAYVGMDGMPPVADAGNVLRPYTTLKLAMRIPPSAEAAVVARELVEALGGKTPPGSTVQVTDVVPADGFDAPETAAWLEQASDEASMAYFGAPGRKMGEGGTIPFLAELSGSYPSSQFLVTGVLGPESNAHGPNEMLHLPTAKRLTASVAHVLSEVPRS